MQPEGAERSAAVRMFRFSMSDTAYTGREGEEIAARYLLRRGYRIIERNIRLKRYEIDIVAFDLRRGITVFAEVKTRSTYSAAYPVRTAVDARKRRAMREAVARWVVAHEFDGAGRIDIICVSGDTVVEHIEDVGSDFF
jgi:putative endonuclease